MNYAEALDQVATAYVPGVVFHYLKQSPDPWQQMHDDYEKVMLLDYPTLEDLACQRFVKTARSLIDRYIASGNVPSRITPFDGMVMKDQERVENWHSRKHKTCALCDTKEKLSLERIGTDGLDIRVICSKCKTSQGSA